MIRSSPPIVSVPWFTHDLPLLTARKPLPDGVSIVVAPCVMNEPAPLNMLLLTVTLNGALTVKAPAPPIVPPASVSLPLIWDEFASVNVAPAFTASSQSQVSVLTVNEPLLIVTVWPDGNPIYTSSVAVGTTPVLHF